LTQKFIYYKNSWLKVDKEVNSVHEEYSYMKNGYFFHNINEFVSFTNISDEEEIEF